MSLLVIFFYKVQLDQLHLKVRKEVFCLPTLITTCLHGDQRRERRGDNRSYIFMNIDYFRFQFSSSSLPPAKQILFPSLRIALPRLIEERQIYFLRVKRKSEGCGVAQRVRHSSEGCGVAQIVVRRLAIRQGRVRIRLGTSGRPFIEGRELSKQEWTLGEWMYE